MNKWKQKNRMKQKLNERMNGKVKKNNEQKKQKPIIIEQQ